MASDEETQRVSDEVAAARARRGLVHSDPLYLEYSDGWRTARMMHTPDGNTDLAVDDVAMTIPTDLLMDWLKKHE